MKSPVLRVVSLPAAGVLCTAIAFAGSGTTKVLFLGNSYTNYNGFPEIFQSLALAGGQSLIVTTNAPGGNTLGAPQSVDPPHASSPGSLSLIGSTDWDFVVLQEQSCIPTIASLKEQYMLPAVVVLDGAIQANDPSTITMLFQTWGRQEGEVCCWGSECSPAFGSYDQAQDAITSAYEEAACLVQASVAPVGEAWRLSQAVDPLLNLYDKDGTHPSLEGSYLAACVFYGAIFGENSFGLTPTAGLPAADAAFLQGIADATVFGPGAYVFDCPGPSFYCTAKVSSAGCNNVIDTSLPGAAPVSGAGGYEVTCSEVQGFKNGLLFAGLSGPAVIPFNGGTLCVQPPTKRGPVVNSLGTSPSDCDGAYAQIVNDGNLVPFGLDAGSGNTAWYQWWYRDPQNGSGDLGTSLSNGVELSFL